MKKKGWLIGIAGVALILVTLVLMRHTSPDKATNKKDGDITRYEWMDLLCDYTGAIEYKDTTPYFKDVGKEDVHFNYIQSAAEWGYIEKKSRFYGDEVASGKFIALSAMKSIGEAKLQIYLETEKEITDKEYLKLAIENGLMEKEDLKKGFSKAEAENVIKKLEELYFTVFWPTDIEKVVYQDDVIQLAETDIQFYDDDRGEITVSDALAGQLKPDDVIVFYSKGFAVAGKIRTILSNDTYALETPPLEEVVDTLIVSDIKEVGFQDIVNYYGQQNLIMSEKDSGLKAVAVSKTISEEVKHKGFRIKIGANSENKLEVEIIDNETGARCQIPTPKKLKGVYEHLEAELNVDSIFVGTQIVYNEKGWRKDIVLPSDIEYGSVAVDVHSEFSGGISAEKEISEEIPLFKKPISLGNGIVNIDIDLNLVFSLDGTVALQAEFPFLNTLHYEKGKGIRNVKHDISVENPQIEASGEMEVKAQMAPTLYAFKIIPVLDARFDVGAVARASITVRETSQICTEVTGAYPIVDIFVGDEDELYLKGKTALGVLGIAKSWELFSFDNALKKFGCHFEVLPDGTKQFVGACTYGNQDVQAETGQTSVALGNTYITEYGDIKFAVDYPDTWQVVMAESDNIFKEAVVLESDKGVRLTYWEFNVFPLGGAGHTSMTNAEAIRLADSAIEGYMVGKIQIIGETDMLTGEEYSIENGIISYAVMPEGYEGVHNSMVGLAGMYEEFSFPYYASRYMIIVESADGKFSKEEESEIIAILSSFRVAEADY